MSPTKSPRIVFASMTVSLDGRITGPRGLHDMAWIGPHAATEQARDELVRMTNSTTVLLGRGNYEGFGGYWPTVADDETADPRDREFARYLNEVEKVVFSRTLQDTPWKNSRLADAEPAEVVRRLRQQEGGDIWVMASKSLLAQLLAADELDRLEIQLAPELLGGGVRYFDDAITPASWTLTNLRTTDSGAIWLTYDRRRAPVDEVAQRYRRRAAEFERKVAGVRPEQWSNPSPCAQWDARGVVQHVVEMHGEMLGPVGRSLSEAPSVEQDPLAAFRSARADVLAVLDDPQLAATVCRTPSGEMSAEAHIDAVLSDDVVLHGWDLAKAADLDAALDPVDVARLWASATSVPADFMELLRTPGALAPGVEVYGAEVAVPEDAPLADRLLGYVGRDPHWSPR